MWTDVLGREQLTDADFQGLRQPNQVQRRAISDPALDPAHVAPPDLRGIGKSLLRQALLLANLTDPTAKTPEGRMSSGLTRRARHV